MASPRDLAVVDIHLQDGSGLALLGEMRDGGWAGGLAISAIDDTCAVRAAIASGVRGFVVTGARAMPSGNRPSTAASLHASLTRVRPQVTDANGAPGGGNGSGACRDLSAREIEVLRLVADGRSNKAIGQAMGLSALTVKSHLARIARKVGTGDRAGMVAIAMRAGIIP
jgi:DNA-binding NarL/FixJ family response regulator